MKDDAKEWLHGLFADLESRVLAELDKRPVYFDNGEELVIKVRFGFTADRNKPWDEKPDLDGEGTYLGATITFAHTESV